jgi:hypothetical protein
MVLDSDRKANPSYWAVFPPSTRYDAPVMNDADVHGARDCYFLVLPSAGDHIVRTTRNSAFPLIMRA